MTSEELSEELLIVSYHEAGHAVLRAFAGMEVKWIEISNHNSDVRFAGETKATGGPNAIGALANLGSLGGHAAVLLLLCKKRISKFSDEQKLLEWSRSALHSDVEEYCRFFPRSEGERRTDLDRFNDTARDCVVPLLKPLWTNVEDIAGVVRRFLDADLAERGLNNVVRIDVEAFASHLPVRARE